MDQFTTIFFSITIMTHDRIAPSPRTFFHSSKPEAIERSLPAELLPKINDRSGAAQRNYPKCFPTPVSPSIDCSPTFLPSHLFPPLPLTGWKHSLMIGRVTDSPRRDLELDYRSSLGSPSHSRIGGAVLSEIGCQPCILHLNHLRSVEIFCDLRYYDFYTP